MRFATIDELTAAEKINSSYVSRLLRLTLLSPVIVEAILDGRQPEGMTLPGLMDGVEREWAGEGDKLSSFTIALASTHGVPEIDFPSSC